MLRRVRQRYSIAAAHGMVRMKAWLLLRSLLFYAGYSLSMVVQSLCATVIGFFTRRGVHVLHGLVPVCGLVGASLLRHPV